MKIQLILVFLPLLLLMLQVAHKTHCVGPKHIIVTILSQQYFQSRSGLNSRCEMAVRKIAVTGQERNKTAALTEVEKKAIGV